PLWREGARRAGEGPSPGRRHSRVITRDDCDESRSPFHQPAAPSRQCSTMFRGDLAQLAELLVDLLEVFEQRLAALARLLEPLEPRGLLGDGQADLHEGALGCP